MTIQGTVSQYQQRKENCTNFVEPLNHFIANNIADEGKKCFILLSASGSSTCKLIQSLMEIGHLAT